MATDQFGQSVSARVPDFTGLEISYLTKSFPGKRGQEYVALENVDLHIRRGEFVSLNRNFFLFQRSLDVPGGEGDLRCG